MMSLTQDPNVDAAKLLERAGRFLQGGQLTEIKSARRQMMQLEEELAKLRESGVKFESVKPATQIWASGFLQTQYVNSDAENGPNDAFRIRRARLNGNYFADAKVMGRASAEFASGSNQTTTQIRDAFIQYRPNTFADFNGPVLTMGQMNTPLGYDISLGSWARTWPERSQYEQALFSGERSRGIMAQVGSISNYAYIGAFNALTVNDPEQVNLPAGQGDKVGGLGGVRFQQGDLNGGVSAFFARRPAYTTNGVTAPEGPREFQYADLRYAPLDSPWEVRSEVMFGRDRVPVGTANAANRSRPIFGGHVQVDYQLNSKDILVLRAETFDRDRDESGRRLDLFGFGYVHDATTNFRLMGSVEFIKDELRPSGQQDYMNITLRAQVRF
jgi:hypothetical protein